MIGIYKIISPTNRIYIGQSVNIKERFGNYKRLDCKYQPKLRHSFLKYGVENHLFEVMCECDVSELNEKERFYQDLYSVLESGLNCILTKTNDRSGYSCEETKQKIGRAHLGKKHSEESIAKMKKVQSNRSQEWLENNNKGNFTESELLFISYQWIAAKTVEILKNKTF